MFCHLCCAFVCSYMTGEQVEQYSVGQEKGSELLQHNLHEQTGRRFSRFQQVSLGVRMTSSSLNPFNNYARVLDHSLLMDTVWGTRISKCMRRRSTRVPGLGHSFILGMKKWQYRYQAKIASRGAAQALTTHTDTVHTRYSPAGWFYLPAKPQQGHICLFLSGLFSKNLWSASIRLFWERLFSPDTHNLLTWHHLCDCPTWERMLVHCCSKDTGGFPRLVASWTLSSCSFWVRLSWRAWAKATAAHQLDRESAENRPPQSSCPAEIQLAGREGGGIYCGE